MSAREPGLPSASNIKLMTAQSSALENIPVNGRWHRNLMAAICFFLLLLVCFKLGHIESICSHFNQFLIWYWTLCLTATVFFLIIPKGNSPVSRFLWILIPVISCRLLLIYFPSGDDVNRYLWEGKMLQQSVNPYAVAPVDPSLKKFRDGAWKKINHKDMAALYPPGSLYLFSWMGRISYSKLFFKWVILGFDVAAVFLLLLILHHKKLDARWALLYALNPVTLVSFAGQVHLDSIMLFFMAASILSYYRGKWIFMFICLGLAFQAKYMAVLLFPFLLKRENLKHLWLFIFISLAPFLPFMKGNLYDPFRSLITFSTEMSHNGSLHYVLQKISGDSHTASLFCFVLFVPGCIFLFTRKRKDRVYLAGISYALLIICSPTVHFWYITWVLPFLCLYPSWSWIVLCWSMGLYFTADKMQMATGAWQQPEAALLMQWLPLYLVMALGAKRFFLKWKLKHRLDEPRTVSLVIPVFNAGGMLEKCLNQVKKLNPAPLEVILVDGGSSDDTISVAKKHHFQVINSVRSRGKQINDGVFHAKGDVTVVLHADTWLERDTLARVLNTLAANPDASGGSVGQQFESTGFALSFIELLNDLRASLLGISFGDQVQFFRTRIAQCHSLVPEIPLMEDVELSLRLGRYGRRVYLWGNAIVSNYKWQGRLRQRFSRVIYLLFVFFYRRSRVKMNVDDLYTFYYGKNP